MRIFPKGRKALFASVLTLFLLSNWPSAAFNPRVAQAATDRPAGPSADAAKEIV